MKWSSFLTWLRFRWWIACNLYRLLVYDAKCSGGHVVLKETTNERFDYIRCRPFKTFFSSSNRMHVYSKLMAWKTLALFGPDYDTEMSLPHDAVMGLWGEGKSFRIPDMPALVYDNDRLVFKNVCSDAMYQDVGFVSALFGNRFVEARDDSFLNAYIHTDRYMQTMADMFIELNVYPERDRNGRHSFVVSDKELILIKMKYQ